MKAEHRHELKTNELAEWMASLPQWAEENARVIVLVFVLLAVAAGVYLYRKYHREVFQDRQSELTNLVAQLSQKKMQVIQEHSKGMDASYILLLLADDLEAAASGVDVDSMGAFALIKRAEALRAELHYRLGPVSEQELTSQINKAKTSYEQAAQKSLSNPSLLAMARFGLGLCQEELGDFEGARQMYKGIIEDDFLKPTVAAEQARVRLATMSDYQREVHFVDLPEPNQASEGVGLQSPLSVPPDVNLPPQSPNNLPEANESPR